VGQPLDYELVQVLYAGEILEAVLPEVSEGESLGKTGLNERANRF
jgi:hypothetical protein